MTDISLASVTSGYGLTSINNNFVLIQTCLNNQVLHTIGGNNVMSQHIDMNGYGLINLGLSGGDDLLTTATADTRYYNIAGDTLAGTLNANSNRITNLPSPGAANDPARKAEVDAEAVLRASGDDTLDDKIDTREAAIRSDSDAAYLRKVGGGNVMGQALDMGGFNIVNAGLVAGTGDQVGDNYAGLRVVTGDTTLVSADGGQLILTNSGSLVTVSLPILASLDAGINRFTISNVGTANAAVATQSTDKLYLYVSSFNEATSLGIPPGGSVSISRADEIGSPWNGRWVVTSSNFNVVDANKLGGVAASDYARKSQANTFTAQQIVSTTGSNPFISESSIASSSVILLNRATGLNSNAFVQTSANGSGLAGFIGANNIGQLGSCYWDSNGALTIGVNSTNNAYYVNASRNHTAFVGSTYLFDHTGSSGYLQVALDGTNQYLNCYSNGWLSGGNAAGLITSGQVGFYCAVGGYHYANTVGNASVARKAGFVRANCTVLSSVLQYGLNVSSVSLLGTGRYRINFSEAVGYGVPNVNAYETSSVIRTPIIYGLDPSGMYVDVAFIDGGGTFVTPTGFTFSIGNA